MEPAMAGIFSLQFGRGFLRSIKAEPALVDKPAAIGMDAGECPSPAEMDIAHFLSRFSRLPKLTLPIGINEDCNPVLFDLKDPRPGPILVIGDEPEGNTNFLRLVASAIAASKTASDAKFMVITPQPAQWDSWIAALNVPESCLGVLSSEDGEADEWVIRLAERVEQRLNGRHMNGPILFMIDNFEFITHTDTDVRLNFEWLCNNGPDAQIWPIFTLPTMQALEMGRWIRYFRTRIIGKITHPAAGRLSIYGGLKTDDFDPQRQFAIRIQDQWLRFWLPIFDVDTDSGSDLDSPNEEAGL
jgi:hypothetical protein